MDEPDSEVLKKIALVREVTVDIKPGETLSTINHKSRGNTPVAVLSSDSLDATLIDPSTAKLDSKGKVRKATFADINNDGLMDVILHFDTRTLELVPARTATINLSADSVTGFSVVGEDIVRVI